MLRSFLSLTVINISMTLLLLQSTLSFADSIVYKEGYKGEAMPKCSIELTIQDGLYIGVQGGYDMFRIASKVPENSFIIDETNAFSLDPTLFAGGGVAGGFVGYGKYFDNFYGVYLGLEVFGNWNGAHTEYDLTTMVDASTAGPFINYYKTEFQIQTNYGIDALPGIRLNPASLFYLRLGYNWANLDINESYTKDLDGPNTQTINFDTDSHNIGGFRYGVGIETTFIESWSIRVEYTHTDFSDIDGDHDEHNELTSGSDFTPASNQFLLGIVYHFNL